MTRFAFVCKECYAVEWRDRRGLVLNAVKGSRRWHTCDECKEMKE